MKKGPLFIVGMPRSGTKLLRSLLNNHSKICIPSAETEIIPYWVAQWAEYGDLTDFSVFLKFYEKAQKNSFFYYMTKHNGCCISANEWHDACDGGSVAEIFEALIRLDTGCQGTDMIWGDKSPSYIRHISLIKELYPNAKIIHIIRDVRDYCLSINNAWGKNMLRAAQRWHDDTSKAKTDIQMMRDSGMEIRFEDLLAEPETVLIDICKMLDISFEQNMTQLKMPTENIGDARGATKIVNENKGKWQRKMPLSLIRRIEEICCSQLYHYGYEIEYQGRPKRIDEIWMRWYKILDGWNLVFSDSDKRGIINNLLFHIQSNKTSGDRISGYRFKPGHPLKQGFSGTPGS